MLWTQISCLLPVVSLGLNPLFCTSHEWWGRLRCLLSELVCADTCFLSMVIRHGCFLAEFYLCLDASLVGKVVGNGLLLGLWKCRSRDIFLWLFQLLHVCYWNCCLRKKVFNKNLVGLLCLKEKLLDMRFVTVQLQELTCLFGSEDHIATHHFS